MSNVLEFVLSLKNMMSGGVREANTTAQSDFAQTTKSILETQRVMDGLGNGVKIKVDSTGIDDAGSKINLMRQSASMMMGSLAARGVEQAADFAVDQLKGVFSSGLDASKLKAEFGVLAGQMEGADLFKNLTKYIQDSIFGTELYGDAKTLLAYGINAREIMPDMKMLGDVAMGDKEKMKSLTLAFGQTTAAGKLMGNDMLQYIAAGFNPLKEMERTTHKSYESLKDLMSEGKISAQMVHDAFVSATSAGGLFAGMLDKIGETPFGKLQAMEGNIDAAKQQLGIAMLPVMSQVMDEFKPLIDDMPAMLEQMRPSIEGLTQDFADMVRWVATHTDTIGNWFNVIKLGTEVFVAYKVVTMGVGVAMNIYGAATKAATLINGLFTTSEIATTAATTAQGYAVTVAASEYAYYTTATAEAAVATEALDAAFALSPWALIAGGVLLVAEAYSILSDKTKAVQPPDMHSWTNSGIVAGNNVNSLKTGVLVAGVNGINTSAWGEPDVKPGSGKNGKSVNSAAVDEASDSIVNGGRRQIIINLNKSLIEKQEFKVGSMGEAMQYSLREQEEMLLRMLTGAAAAVA